MGPAQLRIDPLTLQFGRDDPLGLAEPGGKLLVVMLRPGSVVLLAVGHQVFITACLRDRISGDSKFGLRLRILRDLVKLSLLDLRFNNLLRLLLHRDDFVDSRSGRVTEASIGAPHL